MAVPDVDVCPLPDDPLLAEMASSLRDAGHRAEIVDADWRIVYTTDELRLAQGFMVERSHRRRFTGESGSEAAVPPWTSR